MSDQNNKKFRFSPRGSWYKYRSLNDGCSTCNSESTSYERLKQIILDNELFFSKPSALNDPYDCGPSIQISDWSALIQGALRAQMEKERGAKFQQKELEELSTKLVQSGVIQNIVEDLQKSNFATGAELPKWLDENIGVLSLSKVPDSVLQWAYYGGSNRGVCLEFTLNGTDPWFELHSDNQWGVWGVNYSNKRPNVDVSLISNPQNAEYRFQSQMGMILTKSDHWSHEEEVRIVAPTSGVVKYPSSALTKVIYGLNLSKDDISFVDGLISKSKSQPQKYVCRKMSKEFGIYLEKVES